VRETSGNGLSQKINIVTASVQLPVVERKPGVTIIEDTGGSAGARCRYARTGDSVPMAGDQGCGLFALKRLTKQWKRLQPCSGCVCLCTQAQSAQQLAYARGTADVEQPVGEALGDHNSYPRDGRNKHYSTAHPKTETFQRETIKHKTIKKG
jgi:hypothetical protein